MISIDLFDILSDIYYAKDYNVFYLYLPVLQLVDVKSKYCTIGTQHSRHFYNILCWSQWR